MESKVLKATRRNVTGKQVKSLRRQGTLPAVMYGHAIQPTSISLDAHAASLTLAGLSSSTILTIDLEGVQHAVLVRDRQKDFIRNELIHVDFQVVSQTEKIRTAVRINVQGQSPAVKDLDAVIVHNLNEVEVEAFPQDLPEELVVDVSKIASIGDAIYVRDLVVTENVEILTPGDEIVVVATGTAPEAEEEAEVSEFAEPEVIERGKKEEEDEE